MKTVIALITLVLSLVVAHAQTPQPPVVPFSGVSGIIITPSGTESLTDSEASSIMFANYQAKFQSGLSSDQQNALLTGTASAVAAAHKVAADAPFQIVMDISFTLSFTPAWTTVANEGDTVTVKAGTTIRFGALAGTPCGYSGACNTTALAADQWTTVTLAQDQTFVVGVGGLFPADPAYGYVKVLQVLGPTTTVTKPPTA